MRLTVNKHVVQIHRVHWESCSIMAVIRYQPYLLLYLRAYQPNLAFIPNGCFSRYCIFFIIWIYIFALNSNSLYALYCAVFYSVSVRWPYFTVLIGNRMCRVHFDWARLMSRKHNVWSFWFIWYQLFLVLEFGRPR